MTRIQIVSSACLIVGCLLSGSAGEAQTSQKASTSANSISKAVTLRQQAVALYDQPARAAEAARLHIAEAAARSVRDPEAVEALAMAAHLFNYARRLVDARRAMEQAGQRALAIGDVNRAARAYLDAAFLAKKAHHTRESKLLARRAYLLADSPLLSYEQRDAIRRRIKADPAFAQSVQ